MVTKKSNKEVKAIKFGKEEVKKESSSQIIKHEEGQLIWFIAIIIVIFLAFIIPYLYVQSQKSFDYAQVKWQIEGNSGLTVYHARFRALDESDINYNVYLREDPRENNVTTEGNFTDFKLGGYVSLSKEVDACRGDVARVMIDLGSFLRSGIGVGNLTVSSNDYQYSKETKRPYINCKSNTKSTIISIDIGEPRVIQSVDNKYCYEIYVQDCKDISPVEKFITKTIGDIMEEKAAEELKVNKELAVQAVEESG